MTRRGLGRGLDALLPTQAPEVEVSTRFLEVDVDDVLTNPRQPRRSSDPTTIEELAASIGQLGVLQPLLVRRTTHGYELVAGERRLRAARAAGMERVPVMLVETDERGSLERALVENVHREDLNPLEEAAAYKQLLDDGGLTQAELGERLGRNRVTISNSLRLLDLPVSVQRLLAERRLSSAHGRALAGLEGNPFQERLARRAAEEGLSVRDTEELVRKYQAMTTSPQARAGASSSSPEALEAQRRLSDHLQTRVRVDVGKRKGRIVVDFSSTEELERLTRAILGGDPRSAERVVPE